MTSKSIKSETILEEVDAISGNLIIEVFRID